MTFNFQVGFDSTPFEKGLKQARDASGRFVKATTDDFNKAAANQKAAFDSASRSATTSFSKTAQGSRKAVTAIEKVSAAARRAGSTVLAAGKRGASGFSRLTSAATRSARGIGGAISGLVSGPLASLGLILGGGALAAGFATNALALEKSAAEVATIVDETKVPLQAIIKDGRDLAATFGIQGVEATKALYQAISAGVEPTKAVSFLKDAANLTTAGLGNLEDTTKLLAGTLKSYGLEADKAGAVSDVFFSTVKDGVTNIPELAASIGKVGPLASSAGVSIQELGATVSTLTQSGLSTAEAVTGTRAAIQGFVKPAKEAKAVAEQFGIDLSATGLASRGLGGSLENLKEGLARAEEQGFSTTEVTAQLFGSVEAANAVLKLTSKDGLEKFQGSLTNAQNSLGATDKATGKINKTVGQKLKVALAFAKNEAGKLGTEFLKLVEDGFELIGGIEGVKAAITGLRFAFSGTFKLIAATVRTSVNTIKTLIDGFVAGIKVAGNAILIVARRAQQVKAALSFDFDAAAAFSREAEDLGRENSRLIKKFQSSAKSRSRQNELAFRGSLNDFSKANKSFQKIISGDLPKANQAAAAPRNSIAEDLDINRDKAIDLARQRDERQRQQAELAAQKAADEKLLKEQKAFDKRQAADDKAQKSLLRDQQREFDRQAREDKRNQTAFDKEQRRLQGEEEKAFRQFEREEARRRGEDIKNSSRGVRGSLRDTLSSSFREGVADAGPAFRSALRNQISGVVATIQFDSEARGQDALRRSNLALQRSAGFFNTSLTGGRVGPGGSGIFGQLTAQEAFEARQAGIPGFRNSGFIGGSGPDDSQLVLASPGELFVQPDLAGIVAPIVGALKRTTPSELSTLDQRSQGVNIGEQNFNIGGGGDPQSIAAAIMQEMQRARTLGQEAL